MLFGGLAVYKLRALENHGEVIAFPKLKGLFSVLFSVCCGILGFFYMYTMWSNSNLILMLPFALVGLIIANILVQKSFTLKGALKPFVASFVILLALIVGIHYDVTGFEKRVPDPGNVLYVEFSDNSVDNAYYLTDGEKYYFADVFEPKYSTPEEIELFIDLHKHLIENPQHEDYDYSAPLARKFAHYSYFNFAYTLKNGSKMYRSYRLSGDEVNEYLSMILETKTYRAYQYPVLDGTEKTYVSATVNDVRSSAEDVEYTSAAEVEKIVQAIKKDRENISFEKMVSHRNSEIMTVYLSYEKQLVDSMGNSASDPAVLEDGYSITQDDANTIAALKELGYFDKAVIHDSAEGMTGAVVWYGNEDLYYEYLQITKEQDNDMPETVDYKAFSLNVETDPGAFTYYDVTVWGDDGTFTQTGATDARPQVSVGIPKNDTKQDRTLRLFVNHIYTGVEFVQPAMTDYALYVSHTPASAEYGAFTLSVTCDSDMASFPVVVKGSDGGEWSGTGSKENPTVEIAIPENTGEERTLSIWVNGVDTKKTVKQGKQVVPLVYSVVWSEGYLTVRDGAYVFAAPKERGMYFKYKSQYGFALPDPLESKPKYGGVVYGPTATEMAYADIPYGDTDPCSLVAPAGTWRMPTADELIELTSEGSKEFVVDTYQIGRASCRERV